MWELVTLELRYSYWQISTTSLAGKFLLQSQTKPVLVKSIMDPIQTKGMGTRATFREAEFCLSMKASHLTSLSVFWFPQVAVIFPFLVPLIVHDCYSLRSLPIQLLAIPEFLVHT
jgi:hypothetical protein